jgi:metal-responsive CopG/Arc/MetJ family transcriptional regulator
MSVKEKTRRLNIIISESLHEQLSELVEKHDESKSGFVRLAVEREFERRKKEELEQAAAELAPLYESDEELTAFTSLDSEDFL